jgi:transposase-like protein
MIRRKHDASFKAKIAIEAVKEDMTLAELSNKFSIGPTQIKGWKSELLEHAETIFTKENKKPAKDTESHIAALERKIGQLAIENDFLKKNLLKFPGKSD